MGSPQRRVIAISMALASLRFAASGALAAEPSPAGLPAAAPAGCWLGAASNVGLAEKLAHCRTLGVDLVRLQVQADAAQEPVACEPGGQDCLPLSQLSTLVDGKTRLLLQAPPTLLDAIQSQLVGGPLAGRVWVEPQVQRPQGARALAVAPGVSYQREPRQQPRPLMLHVLRIEAGAGAGYVGTPQLPGVDTPGEGYPALRTSAFLQQQGLLAAINGTYFRPFNGGVLMQDPYVPAAGQAVQISTAQLDGADASAVFRSKDSRVNGVLCVGRATLLPSRTRCPAGTEPLLAAGPMLLEAGLVSSLKAHTAPEKTDASGMPPYYRETHPRTAVAVNRRTGTVWWVVVDGRQPGYSEGMTLPELAALLAELGATDAINLDGGGSTTMALSVQGQAQVMNSPIHTAIPGRERPVADHVGLRLLSHGAQGEGGR